MNSNPLDHSGHDAIAELYAVHEQMIEEMGTIETLANESLAGSVSSFVRNVDGWRRIRAFIKDTLPAHTRDEEEGLFPLLENELASPVELMRFEHRWIDQTEELLFEMLD